MFVAHNVINLVNNTIYEPYLNMTDDIRSYSIT